MTRKQTIVQLDDRLIDQMDRRAERDGVSRSHLIRQAVVAYLATQDQAEISRRIVEGYTRVPQDLPDEWGDPGKLADRLAGESLSALSDAESKAGAGEW